MKIVICDYPVDLDRNLEYEFSQLRQAFPSAELVSFAYRDDPEALIDVLRDADAVINTYVAFDRGILSQCRQLKCIALNAVGYNMVDVEAATEYGVWVCPAAEYCTVEVAEHTLALIFALSRGLRKYIQDIENHIWDYKGPREIERISGKTVTIFGFGKIGRAAAQRMLALGLKVQVVSRSLRAEEAERLGVRLVDWETAMATSDILSNHMEMNAQNAGFFNLDKFRRAAEKRPLFINTGRGGTVVEDDLVQALDLGWLRGAGLDVLADENVDFSTLKLLHRDNVILTPHAGFYSLQSAKDLQDIACQTVIAALSGHPERISKIVNPQARSMD